MSHNFMAYASVTNKFKSKRTMFKYCFMSSFNNILNELYCTIFGNFILRFITYSSALFNAFKNCISIKRSNKFNVWLNNSHNYSSLKLYPISCIDGLINLNNISISSITILSVIPLL